jgi:hypothetical protein
MTKQRMTKSIKTGPLLLLLASLLLSLLYCPPVDIWYDDKAIFRYAGLLIAKGKVPYLDLFDHKPPLIYFLNYAGLCLGSWGLWIIDTLLVAGATLLFYKRCREKALPYPYLLPLFFNLLIRNYLVCEGIGMTRAYTAIFLLIAFCVLLGRSRYTFFWLGLLTTAIFLMQQDQILPLLPFLIYAFTVRDSATRPLPGKILQAAAGFLTIAAPILLYFGVHHALTAFWHDAFLFNFSWYADKRPYSETFKAVHVALKATDNGLPLLLCSTLAVTALLQRTKEKKLLIAALLATALAFGPQLFSARLALMGPSFYYYFLSLCAVLPIMTFTVWTSAGDPFLRSRTSQAFFGFLLCAPLLYNSTQHATHLTWHTDEIVTVTPEYRFLSSQPLSDYQLYVMANNNMVYAYDQFRILAPTPWIYHHFWNWYARWDADHRILQTIGHDLLTHNTRYILDYSEPATFADPSAYTWWRAFLQQHYQPVPLPGSRRLVLWQLKPDAINIPQSADPPAS